MNVGGVVLAKCPASRLNTKLASQIRALLICSQDVPYSAAHGAQAPASWASGPLASGHGSEPPFDLQGKTRRLPTSWAN